VTVAVYLPLLLGLPLWWLAPRLTHRGSPALTARALAAVAMAAAVTTTWSLSLLALTLFDDLPPLSALPERLPEPVPDPIGLAAAVLLLGAAVRLALDLRRRLGVIRRMRAVGDPRAGVVIADLDAPMAVAIPGRPGHLLVTTAMLRALDEPEQRAMMAHEWAHLRHRHHALVLGTAAAAAVNPLLAPAREAVTYLVERWADEEAAAEVGSRELTARAVARAALATVRPEPLLGIAGGVAVRRVQALRATAPEPRHRRSLGAVALIVVFVATGMFATAEFVELARAWL
jgi:Zn-dependent protease with chaperone function